MCLKIRKCFIVRRNEGSNTGKKTRRKNLRHPRERLLVSNEAQPSLRPIKIFPVGVGDFYVLPSYRCLILFLTNILLKVQYFPSWDTPYRNMTTDVTHILTSLIEEWRQRYGKGHFVKRNIFMGKVAWNSYLTHGLRQGYLTRLKIGTVLSH